MSGTLDSTTPSALSSRAPNRFYCELVAVVAQEVLDLQFSRQPVDRESRLENPSAHNVQDDQPSNMPVRNWDMPDGVAAVEVVERNLVRPTLEVTGRRRVLRSPGASPSNIFKLTSTTRASIVEMIKDGSSLS